MKILIGLLLIPTFVMANNGNFLLTASNCQTLEGQAHAVLTWSQKLDPTFSAEIPECKCYSSSSCTMNFYDISPEMVKLYQKKKSMISGPNCWNRALVFAKILPSLSYSTPEEMKHWIESPLCELRETGDDPQPGDLIAIRAKLDQEIHGFTYLTDDLAFSKNGYHKSSPYSYQPLADVFRVYGVSTKCWNVPYTPSSGSCYYKRGEFYNCTSLDNYLEEVGYEPTEFLLNTMTSVAKIDALIEQQLFNTTEFNMSFYREHYYKILEIKEVVKDMLENGDLPNVEHFLWQGLYYRADAIRQQLGIISGQIG